MVNKAKSPKVTAGPGREIRSISIKEFIDEYVYRIDLDADYQREKIWSRKAQLELLDSIVKNIDIPKIYLAEVKDNENFDFECIDGKQRMTTLLSYLKPEPGQPPLTVRIGSDNYTYTQLQEDLPPLAKKIDDFALTFVIYEDHGDEEFLREIFRRLQLGVRLNSGELLKTHTGAIRDFIYKEMGRNAPFLRRTHLSEKRFSRQFTLAQICINSFSRNKTEEFVRARYDDLEDFFIDNSDLSAKDRNLTRIKKVLNLMDKRFGVKAEVISSRAVAVSAYLFVEELYTKKKVSQVSEFAKFFVALLDEIKRNLTLLAKYQNPENTTVLEGFRSIFRKPQSNHTLSRDGINFLKKPFSTIVRPKAKAKSLDEHKSRFHPSSQAACLGSKRSAAAVHLDSCVTKPQVLRMPATVPADRGQANKIEK